MSEIEIAVKSENETDIPKPKYYTENHKVYMQTYRKKHGSYSETQKKAILKYSARIKEEAKKYRELQKEGLAQVFVN